MATEDSTLRSVLLGMTLQELLRGDLLVGVLGAVGAVWLAATNRDVLLGAVPTASALAGVVVGVVIATATIVAAFLNPVFLRKMRAIDEDPVSYLAPYLVSGVLGVSGAIASVVLAATPAGAPTWVIATVGGLTGFLVLYALASMIPNMTNLVRFIRLQAEAAEVPDDLPVIGPRGRASGLQTNAPSPSDPGRNAESG